MSNDCDPHSEAAHAKRLNKDFEDFCEQYRVMKNETDEIMQIVNISDYIDIRKKIETMSMITFGLKINVLIISDRLYVVAKGLQEYLLNSSDINVDLEDNLEASKQIIMLKPIDFLIIVGYLKNKENYESIQAVKKLNKHCCVVMFASLDSIIYEECATHGITYKYHRRHSLDGLIDYMRQIYRVETVQYQRDYSPNREQVWQNAVQLMEQEHLDNERKEHYKKVFCNIEQAVLVLLMVICIVLLCWVKEKSTLLDKEREIEVDTHTQYESQMSKESCRLSCETELPSFSNNKLQYL